MISRELCSLSDTDFGGDFHKHLSFGNSRGGLVAPQTGAPSNPARQSIFPKQASALGFLPSVYDSDPWTLGCRHFPYRLPDVLPYFFPDRFPELLPDPLPYILSDLLPDRLPDILPDYLPDLFPDQV